MRGRVPGRLADGGELRLEVAENLREVDRGAAHDEGVDGAVAESGDLVLDARVDGVDAALNAELLLVEGSDIVLNSLQLRIVAAINALGPSVSAGDFADASGHVLNLRRGTRDLTDGCFATGPGCCCFHWV